MSRSNPSKEMITAEDVMLATSNGLDVFEREIGTIGNKNISSPFRSDSNPSFRVKQSRSSGIWFYKDFGSEETGSCITFIETLYGLTFREAIDKIAWDFGINDKEIIAKRAAIQPEIKMVKENKPILYEFEEMSFNKQHHAYWNAGELTETFLNANNVFAASKIAVNKKVIKVPDNEMCFVYVPDDNNEKGLKILRIGKTVLPQDKWRTNIPNSYLWNFKKYNESEFSKFQLWVLKSRKDELVLNLLGIDTISTQSENAEILDSNMERILPLAQDIVISYGSDADGVKKCKYVQKKHNTLYYNTPRSVLSVANDQFSFVANFGLRALENHIKSKHLL